MYGVVQIATYGLRRGESLGLRWEDIDLDNGCIHVRQQVVALENKPVISELKTDSSERDLPITPQISQVLNDIGGKKSSGLLIHTENGGPISPRNFYRTSRRLTELAGLEIYQHSGMRHKEDASSKMGALLDI